MSEKRHGMNPFSTMAPEHLAIMPPDACGTMDFRTTRERIEERRREEAHWTHRFPEWLKRHLKAWFYRPHTGI